MWIELSTSQFGLTAQFNSHKGILSLVLVLPLTECLSYLKGENKMSKEPSFNFFPSDFLTGTMLMSNEQVGKYIRLLCLQHQQGHLSEEDMLTICVEYDRKIFSKFKQDEQGNYYNDRLDEEKDKRKKFVESRRNNLSKKGRNGRFHL